MTASPAGRVDQPYRELADVRTAMQWLLAAGIARVPAGLFRLRLRPLLRRRPGLSCQPSGRSRAATGRPAITVASIRACSRTSSAACAPRSGHHENLPYLDDPGGAAPTSSIPDLWAEHAAAAHPSQPRRPSLGRHPEDRRARGAEPQRAIGTGHAAPWGIQRVLVIPRAPGRAGRSWITPRTGLRPSSWPGLWDQPDPTSLGDCAWRRDPHPAERRSGQRPVPPRRQCQFLVSRQSAATASA